MVKREGDDRVALMGGFIFMVVFSWFPPFGIIIAGFLTGFLSTRARDGAVIAGLLAAMGALIQIAFVEKILPYIGLTLKVLGFIPLTAGGILSAFGPVQSIFLAFGNILSGITSPEGVAILSMYVLLGAIGGFLGGLVR